MAPSGPGGSSRGSESGSDLQLAVVLPSRSKKRAASKTGRRSGRKRTSPDSSTRVEFSNHSWTVRIRHRHWYALENMAARLEKEAGRPITPAEVLDEVLEYVVLNELEAEDLR